MTRSQKFTKQLTLRFIYSFVVTVGE